MGRTVEGRTRVRSAHRRRSGVLVAVALAGALAAACTSQSDTAAQERSGGGAGGPVGITETDAAPVAGGTVVFGSFSLPATLDPARTVPYGSTGGTEMAAVYDVLVRTDDQTGAFVPQLAEALDTDEDAREFTVTLREDVTFSDGTPLDADAVVASIDRYIGGGGSDADLWRASVERTEAIDARTVRFTLARPWADFPTLLATGAGMIVAPAADEGEEFTPIGAGPFTVTAQLPGDRIEMTAREDYYGGAPLLDGLRFVPMNEASAQLDTMRMGELDMTFVHDAGNAAVLAEEGFAGYLEVLNGGTAVLINQDPGRPGADERVRRAVLAAMDPELIDERGQDGAGRPGTALFPASSQWATDGAGDTYDPDAARELVEQAKADGFDGRISFTTRNAPEARERAIALQAQLAAVGIDMEIDLTNSVADQVRVTTVYRDFDLAQSGLNIRDREPLLKLYSNFHSEAVGNISGYDSPEMDALLTDLQTAPSEQDKAAVLAEIDALMADQVPAIVMAAQDNMVAWQPGIHDVVHSFGDIVLLGQAWIEP